MAEAAALTSIAKSAFQLFTSLAKDEFLLLWHSEKDLKRLRVTIETISDFLLDAEERKSTDRSVQRCLSDLRKVMYDAEDLFDALAAHALRKKALTGNAFTKEVRLFFSKSNQLGFVFRTHEVKSLRRSLDEIAKNMKQFSFILQPQPVDQSFRRKKTHSFVREEDIIGRNGDKDHIITMLIPRDKNFSVVAIIGFGGLGETALAQLVYNDERVKQGFDVHLWACINYLSNLEQVLKEIISSKVERKQLDLSVQMLQEKLREIIGGRKFLIVLDDVWDENSGNWLDLETILRCGKRGSKVLVTTRSARVAKCLHASEPYLDLRGLSEESAWSLFAKRAYQGEEPSEHPELEPIGKKILGKCGNVPLAILTVGSLLAQKRREERIWEEFFESKLEEVLSSGDENSIKQVLMVSYNDLHPNLKLCFAVCSLFPKDYKFDKDHLVQLWLAQGIVRPCVHNKQSLEEVGEAYFFHLVDRCFFQELDYSHRHKCTAKMHDLLHDIAIDVAKSEYLLLDKVIENKGEIDDLRHISIAFGLEDASDCCSLVSDPKTVRTFLFRHNQKFSKSSFTLLGSFTMLRTLYLSNSGIDGVPESIGGLIHLRYLDLSFNAKLKHLPNSICKLHHLMIFVLEGCYLLEKLPLRIEKLVSLRQLFIGGCNSLDSLPPGLKELTSLINLDRLIVHRVGGGLGYLKGLDQLAGVLRIELPKEGWLDAIEDARNSNMARKNKLNEMSIEWKRRSTTGGDREMARDEAKAVLEGLQPHENLEYLRVGNYGGEMLPSWFRTLKYVKVLQLYECDNVEYLEDGMKGSFCFPSLKLLTIEAMRNLKGWWRQETAQVTSQTHLSSVSSFAIFRCPKLRGRMPLFEGIEYLDLSEVDVEVVTELLDPFNNNSKLKELQLCTIEGLNDLPERRIKHLTALQRLTIEHCRGLRRVSRRGLAHLTALKTIRLGIGSGEIGDEDDEGHDMMRNEAAGMPWKALQGLVSLTVGVGDSYLLDGLRYLTSLGVLEIEKWKDVQLQLAFPAEPLRNLRTLSMGFGNETFHLPRSGIQHLRSLANLIIRDCKDLYLCWKTLVGMKLEILELNRVERVNDVEYDMMMVAEQQSLLRNLKISEGAGAKWVDDIPWISLSSSLEYLCLKVMGERKHLPDGIQHLTSLRSLEISGCEEVTTLPNWISQLPTLRRLSIQGCSSELKRRCQRGRGDDWLLIRHLPYTYFY